MDAYGFRQQAVMERLAGPVASAVENAKLQQQTLGSESALRVSAVKNHQQTRGLTAANAELIQSGSSPALIQLAWDAVCSTLGSCQMLYKRLFLGDPDRMASAFYHIYDKEPLIERVCELLGKEEHHD